MIEEECVCVCVKGEALIWKAIEIMDAYPVYQSLLIYQTGTSSIW